MGAGVDSQSGNEKFYARSRQSRDCAEAYIWYVAQAIPQMNAEIAENGHLWTGNWLKRHAKHYPNGMKVGSKTVTQTHAGISGPPELVGRADRDPELVLDIDLK